jgi:hypothetical protein
VATTEDATQLSTRFPRVINRDEIDSLPRLRFSEGCESSVFLSRERDDARYFYHGLCYHGADMEDFEYEQASWDESYYCLKGRLRVIARDADGNETVLEAGVGEHIYMPAGYTYTLTASGEESLNFWTLGPALKAGIAALRDIDLPDAPEFAKKLRATRGSIGGAR